MAEIFLFSEMYYKYTASRADYPKKSGYERTNSSLPCQVIRNLNR
jgi:hypothetical protein